MKKKSGCFRILLAFVLALVATILFRACTLKAYATPVQLTPEQTLALYGTSLNATYYNSNTGLTRQISFEFMNFTDNWTSLTEQANDIDIGFKDPLYNDTSGYNAWAAWAHSSPGLIYFSFDSWAGTENNDFISSNTSDHANIYINQSIDLTNLSRYRQYFWYSGWVDAGGSWGNPQYTYANYSSTFSGNKVFYAMNNNAWQSYNRKYTYGIWPCYNRRLYAESTEFEDALGYMYGIYTDLDSENNNGARFDITGCDYTLNGCQVVDITGLHFEENNTTYLGNPLVLIIGCPELDGEFIGPTMPTTTAVTTMTTQLTGYTGETISGTYGTGIGLDDISTDLAEIIRNQRWQIQQNDVMIQNGRRTNDNLSIIIEQLNKIYTNMVANGEIPLNLVPAAALDTIPEDVAGRIQTALRGTWPTMPNNVFGDAPALVGEFWSLCTSDGFEIFLYLGCFCLSCSVAAWVLFKGRG